MVSRRRSVRKSVKRDWRLPDTCQQIVAIEFPVAGSGATVPLPRPARSPLPQALVADELTTNRFDDRHARDLSVTLLPGEAKRVLVVGLGNMGLSHARAYAKLPGFESRASVPAACTLWPGRRRSPAAATFTSFDDALATTTPDIVSINTFPDTHAEYAIKAMEAGAHVFVEKPLAETVAEAERVVETAVRTKRKLVIGYILRHHPSWLRFIELAKTLGTPLVFRMNLNQQSSGAQWETHKNLLNSLSPIVDCGVHYVDIWCQITPREPAHRPRRRRAADRRPPSRHVQLRPPARHVRRCVRGLVRGGVGTDDERDGVLREGRHRPEGLGLDRAGRRGGVGEVRRHQRAHANQPAAASSCGAQGRRHVRAGPTNASRRPTNRRTTICASASSDSC